MENHEKTLTESISDAKMEFERLQALLSEKEAEMKREEILKNTQHLSLSSRDVAGGQHE